MRIKYFANEDMRDIHVTIQEVNDFCAQPGVEIIDIVIPDEQAFFVKYRKVVVGEKPLEELFDESASLEAAVRDAAGDGNRQIKAEAEASRFNEGMMLQLRKLVRKSLRTGIPPNIAEAIVKDWWRSDKEHLYRFIDGGT